MRLTYAAFKWDLFEVLLRYYQLLCFGLILLRKRLSKADFRFVVQKIETSCSTRAIAIQLYFIRIFLVHQMAITILSTAYEAFPE